MIYLLLAIAFCCVPWYIEALIWLCNLFIPDSIPIIDEMLMFVPIIIKIKNILHICDAIKKHWKIVVILLGGTLILAIAGIWHFTNNM
jgi:hypothetical protein